MVVCPDRDGYIAVSQPLGYQLYVFAAPEKQGGVRMSQEIQTFGLIIIPQSVLDHDIFET